MFVRDVKNTGLNVKHNTRYKSTLKPIPEQHDVPISKVKPKQSALTII